MPNQKVIFICPEGHHFLETKNCPFCGKEKTTSVEYREGDCISCGKLCPSYAYGCNSPQPIKNT